MRKKKPSQSQSQNKASSHHNYLPIEPLDPMIYQYTPALSKGGGTPKIPLREQREKKSKIKSHFVSLFFTQK